MHTNASPKLTITGKFSKQSNSVGEKFFLFFIHKDHFSEKSPKILKKKGQILE